MSNELKCAIDQGLNGLYVTQRDADAILARIRQEKQPQPRQCMRFVAVIAAVLVMVLLGTAWSVLDRIGGQENNDPLTGPDATLVTPVTLTIEDAISLAEAHIHQTEAPRLNLRDETQYRIHCEYLPPDAACNAWHYRVTFQALTIEGTDYLVDVLASPGTAAPIHRMTRQRGVGEGHSAAEMRHGYSRVYGTDLAHWPWTALNAYCTSLLHANPTTFTWADELISQGNFLDPTTVSPAAEAAQATSAVLMQSNGRALWKLTIPDPNDTEWVRLLEKDVKTGEVVSDVRVDRANVGFLPIIPTETITKNWQVPEKYDEPTPSVAFMQASAAAWFRERYGETRNVNDPSLYTCMHYACSVSSWKNDRLMYYVPVSETDPWYWALLDSYGNPIDSGRCTFHEDGRKDLDEIRFTATQGNPREDQQWDLGHLFVPAQKYEYEELTAIQAELSACGDMTDPIAKLIASTEYRYSLADRVDIFPIVGQHLNVKIQSALVYKTCLKSGERNVVKAVYDTDRGIFLVEVDAKTEQVTNVLRVENLTECWYAPFLLQADMEAAGIAPKPYTPPENDGDPTIDPPYQFLRGMRIDYLCAEFRQLYSPDVADWSQEQLRVFQQFAIMSGSQDCDMGIYALRRTYYPDIPARAISREDAAQRAIAHLNLTGYISDGAVLIGTSGTPVWKVCLRHETDGYWYAEVDCMTGEVRTTVRRQDQTTLPVPYYSNGDEPLPEYWFRDIVLEETIHECEQDWDRKSNG